MKFLTELLKRTLVGKTVEFSHLLEPPWDLSLKWPRNILFRNGVTLEHRRGRVWREGVPRIRIDFASWIQFLRLLEAVSALRKFSPFLPSIWPGEKWCISRSTSALVVRAASFVSGPAELIPSTVRLGLLSDFVCAAPALEAVILIRTSATTKRIMEEEPVSGRASHGRRYDGIRRTSKMFSTLCVVTARDFVTQTASRR